MKAFPSTVAASVLALGLACAALSLAGPPDNAPKNAPQPTATPEGLESRATRGLAGSAHDFTDGGRAPRDLCLPCHTPHITAAQAELLTHGSARSRQGGQEIVFDDSSLLCLSCHDGITAHDVYATSHAGVWPGERPAASAMRQNRLTSHPVGIRYPTGEPKYVPAAGVTAGGRITLPDGRIQCITCHDPHNTEQHPGMLVISNEGSRLCLACHQL